MGARDEEYKKVLSARRRLLGMLLALAAGSAALAYTRMAAWWVVVPPTVMLLGYLALLREASKADAERRELARATAAAAVAAARRAAAPPVSPAPSAPAPDAEVIDISATLTAAGQEFYDQYADAKLRAVGDLTHVCLAGRRLGSGHYRRTVYVEASSMPLCMRTERSISSRRASWSTSSRRLRYRQPFPVRCGPSRASTR
jgi:hypothetical protein